MLASGFLNEPNSKVPDSYWHYVFVFPGTTRRIEDTHAEYQLAGYIRAMVINPLHPGLPSLTVMVHAHCNRFTTSWLCDDWKATKALMEEHISPHLGDFIGRGSDGDARRFALMKAAMSRLPSEPGRFGLHEAKALGFTMSCLLLKSGAIAECHAQDPRHNWAKLWAHTDSAVRRLRSATPNTPPLVALNSSCLHRARPRIPRDAGR